MHSVEECQIDGPVEYPGRIVVAEETVAGHLVQGAKRFIGNEISRLNREIGVYRDCRALCEPERPAGSGPNFQIPLRTEPLMYAFQDMNVMRALMVGQRSSMRLPVNLLAHRTHLALVVWFVDSVRRSHQDAHHYAIGR